MFVHVEINDASVCVDACGVKPLIGVTTSELRPGELATVHRNGEPSRRRPTAPRPPGRARSLWWTGSRPGCLRCRTSSGAWLDRARPPTHLVTILSDSRLATALGTTQLSVNSFHHQAVDCLGTGLHACAWAPDGTIEAVEDGEQPFVLAVQWHAETLRVPGQEALIEELVSVASGATRLRQVA